MDEEAPERRMTAWTKGWWALVAAWEVVVLAAALSSSAPALTILTIAAAWLMLMSMMYGFVHLLVATSDTPPRRR